MEMRMFRMHCRIITGLSVLLAALGAIALAVEKPHFIVLTDTGAWICHNFPQVLWIRSVNQFQALQLAKNRCGGRPK
jgi:hypothetical protein